MPRIVLPDLNLENAERLLVIEALAHTGSMVEAAQLLGVSRGRLARMIVKHRIEWPRPAEAK